MSSSLHDSSLSRRLIELNDTFESILDLDALAGSAVITSADRFGSDGLDDALQGSTILCKPEICAVWTGVDPFAKRWALGPSALPVSMEAVLFTS